MERNRKVLLVDDDTIVHLMVKRFLEEGFEVIPFADAETAMEYLLTETVDLILLDLNLPGMDGFQMMKIIYDNPQYHMVGTPVIFLTGNCSAQVEEETFQAGAADLITKPFSKEGLCSRIERAIINEESKKALSGELQEKTRIITELTEEVSQDGLTGLLNRKYAEERIEELLATGGTGCFLMMDMDKFKMINDIYGHARGDYVLRQMADVLEKCVPESSIICRNGGDEFFLFVESMTGEVEIAMLAGRIIDELQEFLAKAEIKSAGTVSVGISIAPEDGRNFDELFRAADKALYHVKREGRNNYFFYSQADSEKTENVIPLQHLSYFLQDNRSEKTAFRVGFQQMHSIYNFLCRYMERNHHDVQMILYTFSVANDYKGPMPENAVENLERAVQISLRQSDVFTRFSGRQLIVLLIDTDGKNAEMCAERILKRFRNMEGMESVMVEYKIAEVTRDNMKEIT